MLEVGRGNAEVNMHTRLCFLEESAEVVDSGPLNSPLHASHNIATGLRSNARQKQKVCFRSSSSHR